jgi:hopanoid biosynthesis associated protein HpnK
MPDRRLIINADDFGLTRGVNRAIIEAHRRGIVTSASLMSGGEAFEEAADLARQNPRLGVGVHLTLVNGRPVCGPESIPSLVTPQGRFFGSPFKFISRLELGLINLDEVRLELRAQICRALESGIRVTHVDGHKHLHIYPRLLEIVLSLMMEFGIKRMRLPLERPALTAGSLNHYLVYLASMASKKKLARAKVYFTDHFIGLSETGSLNEPRLRRILSLLPAGTTEVMCHPGYDDEALGQTGTRLRRHREEEFKALTNQSVIELIRESGIELISYGDIN